MDIRSLAEAVMETAGKIKNDNMSDQDFYKFKFTELNQKSSKELFFLLCAGHGTNSVGNKPTTGIYRQV